MNVGANVRGLTLTLTLALPCVLVAPTLATKLGANVGANFWCPGSDFQVPTLAQKLGANVGANFSPKSLCKSLRLTLGLAFCFLVQFHLFHCLLFTPSYFFLLQPFSKLSSPIINQPNTSKLCSKSWEIHSFIICNKYSIKPHEIALIHTRLIKSKEAWKSTQLACFWLKKVHKTYWNQRKKKSKSWHGDLSSQHQT